MKTIAAIQKTIIMIPRSVRFAIFFSFLFHGLFILSARYRLSYDAYTHMLFANHYAKDWFSLWETRWYTGFDIVSYPPLIHQIIAIFTPAIGFDAAYALILWLVTTLFPLGIYTFSRIFIGKTASSYAAAASAVMLPIYVTAHIFGQLPFLSATLFALFGASSISKFLREGTLASFLLAVSITSTTMAAHHATLMVQPFLIFAITFYQLNKQNWKTTLLRLFIFLVCAVMASIFVIWPFWQWGIHQQLQTPIDHPSRHNFFIDPFAFTIFFLPFYFPIGAAIPFLFHKWPLKFAGLQLTFIILFILGLGGTTPLPNILFGKSWEWLTYDRFAFWASLILTPFFGILFIRFKKWMKNRIILKPIPASLRGIFISSVIFSVFTFSAVGSWLTPLLFPTQPKPVEMQPIADFLEAEDHYYWRYLTFGFGDQFAYLNLLTDKTSTLDGSYHTARKIPELRESGIGQIDTAYWTLKGIPAIGPILQASGKYGVRWGFVNRNEYIPELKKNGWVFVKFLKNGIQVWENPQFTFKPAIIPQADPFESFSWGVFPLLSLFTSLTLGIINIVPKVGETILRKAHFFTIGLLPLSLGFWYYKTVFEFKHNQVYFTYDHALFFLSDALALIAVILWLTVQVQKKSLPKLSTLPKLLLALCAWMTLSAFWSVDWRTSLSVSAHFWLILLLVLSMQDWHEGWNAAVLGFCAGLIFQTFTGLIEFATQSTQLIKPLNLTWPGLLSASSKGASILKYTNGENFLRAYGSFPHPNILGGYILTCIALITAFAARQAKLNLFALTLLIPASLLIAITFSRSAWLGLVIFFLVLLLKARSLKIKKISISLSITLFIFELTLLPLQELFLSRTTTPTSTTEEFSLTGRTWLINQAFAYIKEKPFTGIGLGSFVIQLAKRSGEFNYVEPVHNIPLLVFSELGIVGVILLLAIFFVIIKEIIVTSRPNLIIIGALLASLGTISLFDHYLWSLAPGRTLLGIVLGLWLGQVKNHDE